MAAGGPEREDTRNRTLELGRVASRPGERISASGVRPPHVGGPSPADVGPVMGPLALEDSGLVPGLGWGYQQVQLTTGKAETPVSSTATHRAPDSERAGSVVLSAGCRLRRVCAAPVPVGTSPVTPPHTLD